MNRLIGKTRRTAYQGGRFPLRQVQLAADPAEGETWNSRARPSPASRRLLDPAGGHPSQEASQPLPTDRYEGREKRRQ